MNILFICNEFPPATQVGGIGIFVKNIAAALVQKGHQVTVVGLYKQPLDTDELTDSKVRVVRLAAKKIGYIGWWLQRKKLAKKIAQLHREAKIDIIETSDYESGYWLLPPINVPRVVRLNGGEVYFRSLLHEPLRKRHWWREYTSLKKSDAIASVSKFTWLATKRLFKLKEQDVAILNNPVDTTFFKPDSSAPTSGCILYSGAFIRKKGVLDLFQCMNQVFENNMEAHLVCVGVDSRDATTGSASTIELALSYVDPKYHKRIRFAGRVPHDQVLQYIQQASICVYPSYLEAFPNAWIEAMACGKPVIGSSTGSGPEVIEDEKTGLLCHPADHKRMTHLILKLLTDHQLRIHLGENARKFCLDNLEITKLTDQNIQWYQRVITRYHKER